jgi:predicted transcriptional regulator
MTAYLYKHKAINNFMQKTRKTKEEIENQIILTLKEKPLSIQQISQKVNSNWSTINEILDKLKKEGKVREIIATEKIRIYRLSDYPVFYSLPIQGKHKNLAIFILSEIAKSWRKKYNTSPPLTTLQKIAVDVVKENNLEVPVLPFHYGLVLPVFSSNTNNISTPENSKAIISAIKKILPLHSEKAWKEEINQYKKYNMDFFMAKNKVNLAFESRNKKEIESAILKLSWEFPNDEENANVFELFDRFVYCSTILLNWKDCNIEPSELKDLFEKIWDLVTSNMFLNEAKKHILKEDMQFFEIIRISTLNSKISIVEEEFCNIKEIVDSIDPERIEMPMDKESIKIRDILTENADYE